MYARSSSLGTHAVCCDDKDFSNQMEMFLVLRFRLLFLLLICCHYATATVVLDSSVDMRGVCPGEIVTYTCTVIQGVFLDWIVEPFLPATERIQFTSTTATESSLNCNNVAAVSCSVFDFVATLINTTNSNTVMSTTLADMTSTLTFTATVRLNGTVIQCRGTTAVGLPITNNTLNVAAIPSPPRIFSYTVEKYGHDMLILTVQWQLTQNDGGAPVNYTITVSPGVGTFTTSRTSVPVTVPYNVIHTVSIVATNCNGSSSATMVTIPAIGLMNGPEVPCNVFAIDCGPPVPPLNGSLESYTNTTEGSEVFYRCDPGLVPEGRMRAVCTRNGWSPNPAGLSCNSSTATPTFNCGPPFGPRKGALERYTDTTIGSEVFYTCYHGLIPEGRMRTVCTRNGWSPNPAHLSCTVGCSLTDLAPNDAVRQCTERGFANILPIPNGVVCYSRTTPGSEAVYICDEGFHQDGAATRTCQNDSAWNGSMSQCSPNLGRQDGSVGPFTTGAIVGIAVSIASVLAFIAGILAAIPVYYCISKHQFHQSSKPEPSSHQQQEISPSNPLQLTDPEYAEVIKLRKNKAYELTQTGIEMRANQLR